jgi:hypothetical protein
VSGLPQFHHFHLQHPTGTWKLEYIPSAMLAVGHLVGQAADDVKLLAFASAVDMKRIVFHRAPKPSLKRHYQSNPTVISYLHLWM